MLLTKKTNTHIQKKLKIAFRITKLYITILFINEKVKNMSARKLCSHSGRNKGITNND